jgi:hypothetical protein
VNWLLTILSFASCGIPAALCLWICSKRTLSADLGVFSGVSLARAEDLVEYSNRPLQEHTAFVKYFRYRSRVQSRFAALLTAIGRFHAVRQRRSSGRIGHRGILPPEHVAQAIPCFTGYKARKPPASSSRCGVFNLVGPLNNPAGTTRQFIGAPSEQTAS